MRQINGSTIMKYETTYTRIETRTIKIYCEASTAKQACDIFDKMIEDSITGKSLDINFDEMECIDAEDYINELTIVCTDKK